MVHTVDPQCHQLKHRPMTEHIVPREQLQRVLLLDGFDYFPDPSREESAFTGLTHKKFTLFAR
jgi:hypothetical protein